MKEKPPVNIERCRVTSGPFASTHEIGCNGMFRIQYCDELLTVVVSDQSGWDHISVSAPMRCPTWEEMNFIKNLFFDKEECAVQMHPPESVYVNYHPYVLHIWKKQGFDYPIPPLHFV